MLTILMLWWQLLTDPRTATILGAMAGGHPEFVPELLEICEREAPGHACARNVGLHPNNRIVDVRAAYKKAISLRHLYLHPECAAHVVDATSDSDVMRFGVRGVHGLMAAYSVRYLGPCVAPEALDSPFLSALAATRRAEAMCAKSAGCSKSDRHVMWIGAGLESKRLRRGLPALKL